MAILRLSGWIVGALLALAGLLAFAWLDAGREPVRELSAPVALPEAAQ